MKFRNGATFLITASIASHHALGQIVSESFDADHAGWTACTSSGGRDPTWVSEGGNPGGFIRSTESGDGDTTYWCAPEKLLGDLSDAYGGELRFDLRQHRLDEQYHTFDVELRRGSIILRFETSGYPLTTWTPYVVPLTPAAGWRIGDLAGEIPTEGDFLYVLDNLESLKIRAEYRGGTDVDDLDNVAIWGPTCPGDFNGDGILNLFDFLAFQAAFGNGC